MARGLNFDFDIHPKTKYMYFWIKDYMLATYELAHKMPFSFKGKIVHDIGVGRGRTFTIYKALGLKKIVGIDVDEKETRYAVKQAKRLHLDLKLIIDTLSNLKLQKIPSNSCEVVTLMNILFCLPSNQSRLRIIKEAKRIIKPRGVLIVMDMQKPSLMWLISRLARKDWKFRSYNELLNLMKPLKLIAYKPSNYFYFINSLVDLIGKLFGPKIFQSLNNVSRLLRVPGSTRTFIFTKK